MRRAVSFSCARQTFRHFSSRITNTSFVRYVPNSSVVLIDYADLVKGADLSKSIAIAYGEDGLGILAVSGVPEFKKLKFNLLPLAYKFANLPESIKSKYEHKASLYSFGWSHGKEKLSGKPDLLKGSYYNNPIYDEPYTDKKIIEEHAPNAHPNIWPREDMPELEPAFKAMGRLCTDVGALLALHCDRFVSSQCSTYKKNRLHHVITTSRISKARLLHYFPQFSQQHSTDLNTTNTASTTSSKNELTKDSDIANWCGWHNDHGSLTSLVSAIYIDKNGKIIPPPDSKAGLYIQTRKGTITKVVLPGDCLGFQIGESQQIHSGGILQATPHCVVGPEPKGEGGWVSRETFAVFLQPQWDELMDVPSGIDASKATYGSSSIFLPVGMPPLEKRWKPGYTFGKFSEETFAAYY